MSAFRPKFATITTWMLLSGISRRNTYEHLRRGNLKGHKVGSRTLIDVDHGLAWIESHPGPSTWRPDAVRDPTAEGAGRAQPDRSALAA
jgi:hypothetical protein